LPQWSGNHVLRSQLNERVADLTLLCRLDELRLEQAEMHSNGSGYNRPSVEAKYRQAFINRGFDVLGEDFAATQAAFEQSAIRIKLVPALADWSRLVKSDGPKARIHHLATVVDPYGLTQRIVRATRNKDANALRQLAAEVVNSAPPAIVDWLAAELLDVSATNEAEQLLRAGLRRYPSDFWLNLELGLILEPDHDAVPSRSLEALGLFRVALALRPHSAGMWLNVGHSLHTLKRFEEAEAAYWRAIELKQNYAQAFINLVNTLRALDRPDEAVKAGRRALDLAPSDDRALTNLGIALEEAGNAAEAGVFLRRAIKIDPKNHMALFGLGNALNDMGQWREAEAVLREAVTLKPGNAAAFVSLGNALMELGKLDDAVQILRQAITLSPIDGMAHYNLGTALLGLNRPEEALLPLRRAIHLMPNYAEAYTNLGGVLLDLHKPREALEPLRHAVALKPALAIAHSHLGDAFGDLERLAEAEVSYRQAIELIPDYAGAICNLAGILQRQGRFVESLAEYRRGHEIGMKLSTWNNPSAKWVETAEMLVAVDALFGNAWPSFASQTLMMVSHNKPKTPSVHRQ
jgi:tetratricopeptide (TPR) repeat protein